MSRKSPEPTVTTEFPLDALRLRRNFARIPRILPVPKLIELQKTSYDAFLHRDPQTGRSGLHGVFNSVFPIKAYGDNCTLEFVNYTLEKPKYDVEECRARDRTYDAPLRVMIRMVQWAKDDETGESSIVNVKEQEVYFGEVPLMTDNGTFIINGTERVVVSQLHRSPGVIFERDDSKSKSPGKQLFTSRVIPGRGSWLDFEFDTKDILYVRIDRKRKLPATVLLRALPSKEVVEEYWRKGRFELPDDVKYGLTNEELLQTFYGTETIFFEADGRYTKTIDPEFLSGQTAAVDVVHPKTGEVLVKKGKKFSRKLLQRVRKEGVDRIETTIEDVVGRYAARDVVDDETGEILLECNEGITQGRVDQLRARGVKKIDVLMIDGTNVGEYLRNTLVLDKLSDNDDPPTAAREEIFKRMRPGEPPTEEACNKLMYNLFFNPERYDLTRVGRLKVNYKFGVNEPLENTTLTSDDIIATVRFLLGLRDGRGNVDDIDHLGNRRVRAVGELIEQQYRLGLVRMERAIKERMNLNDMDSLNLHDLVNSKPVSGVVKEFFGSSQLSQLMDQSNPLSEVTHKRRLSALGPGGLTRERAGFEVRDVHPTHYGRICPIETPEGPNIGLIASLSTFARVNEYGFIETPYRSVADGVVTNDVRYYSALEEKTHTIAQANTPVKADGRFADDVVYSRRWLAPGGEESAKSGDDAGEAEFVAASPGDVTLMDISPNQLVSVAASLVPFLENDDGNRALMGSNMQRQAVPLLKPQAPIVGTGMEAQVARDSGVVITARRGGTVEAVDATRIVVRADPETGAGDDATPQVDIYSLTKWHRSNQTTCFNQRVIVRGGDRVKAGDVLADGPSTDRGELALGRNVVVAFMPWGGYNFEDSILVNERLIAEDVFTSVHIEEFETNARDTKLGKEEITRDIPNVGEEALVDLDESGIVRIGAEVKTGDILVGKITPKGETQLTPEEKLLRAIFGEKAADVKDSSLRVPPGVSGVVIGAKVFSSRKGADRDARTKEIEDAETNRLLKLQNDQIRIIQDATLTNLRSLVVGKKVGEALADDQGKVLFKKGDTLDGDSVQKLGHRLLTRLRVAGEPELEVRIERILQALDTEINRIKDYFADKIDKLKRGDDLQPGVLKMVKVYVAMKRKLSVGDKMAGRHGNKGVVSRILPSEDMPYLPDGTPVDIVLNPLGVPSRMNVGQILETHLGWAGYKLGDTLRDMMDQKFPIAALRDKLKKIFQRPEAKKALASADDAEVLRIVQQIIRERGVHMATPVFDGATEADIHELLEEAGLSKSGQTILFDGRTGDAFHQDVTVGVMYMLKLHHLVDDKIHARSIGPYSLVTQQPLGGKAQFGGQRLGEMEVWAMEAYGAAHTLQEFLTVKSDDIVGRTLMYQAIVNGEHKTEPGVPESFNVLVKELQSLGLSVDLLNNGEPAQPVSRR